MINLLAINVLLALAWSALIGEFSLSDIAVGFVFSYAALWVAQPLYGRTTYFRRSRALIGLVAFFAWDLLASGVRVLWNVLTPHPTSRPGIVAVPLDVRGDGAVLLLANLISLTPGSLSLEVSEDRSTLFVHFMFLDEDADAARRSVKQGLERRILRVLARDPGAPS